MRIGIPRTLWYFTYASFWQTFFTRLGAEVVLSHHTNRTTMDAGVATCVSEACLPIKVYFGHVIDVADRADHLFVPRMMCLHGRSVFCPKFIGLPDMVRHSGLTLPPLLDVKIDRRTGPLYLWRACLQLASHLGVGSITAMRAYHAALREQRTYDRKLAGGAWPEGAKPVQRSLARPAAAAQSVGAASGPRVALLGYPYLIFDDYANLGLLEKLARFGITYRTIETVSESTMRRQNPFFGKRPFWRYSDMVARSGYHFLGPGSGEVDGVIHVTAFACGPDALVDKLLDLQAERCQRPYLNITLDEQSGEAGYVTRLEAFVDMLRQRGAADRAKA